MDNLFEILIYLFIIFSIFSPLFKKKKEQPPVPPQRRMPEEEHIPTSRTTMEKDPEEYDILKEIETLFKTDTSVPPEIKSKQSTIERAEAAQSTIEKAETAKRQTNIERLRSETLRSAPEINRVESEHKYSDWTRKITIDDSIARKAEEFSEMMKKRSKKTENESIVRLRNKLNNPQTLKDYIIFAEILGKPKALKK